MLNFFIINGALVPLGVDFCLVVVWMSSELTFQIQKPSRVSSS
jgi:hypothetical protein